MGRVSHQERLEDVILRTRPVMYVPMQGSMARELVRQVNPLTNTAVLQTGGGSPGMTARRFTASTADNDKLVYTSDASYHPADTFSVGGWFNRMGQGDAANAPSILHWGTNDFTVYFPLSVNTDKLVLRKAGVGDVMISTETFDSPFDNGWRHAIFTKTGATRALYIDGVSTGTTGTNQTIVASASNPTIGTISGADTNDFDGALAHWALWNRVLTAAEVVEMYRAGKELR
jgi:hypothetical protein